MHRTAADGVGEACRRARRAPSRAGCTSRGRARTQRRSGRPRPRRCGTRRPSAIGGGGEHAVADRGEHLDTGHGAEHRRRDRLVPADRPLAARAPGDGAGCGALLDGHAAPPAATVGTVRRRRPGPAQRHPRRAGSAGAGTRAGQDGPWPWRTSHRWWNDVERRVCFDVPRITTSSAMPIEPPTWRAVWFTALPTENRSRCRLETAVAPRTGNVSPMPRPTSSVEGSHTERYVGVRRRRAGRRATSPSARTAAPVSSTGRNPILLARRPAGPATIATTSGPGCDGEPRARGSSSATRP